MTQNALAVRDNENTFIAPVASVTDALKTYQAMKEFIEGALCKDVDFGTIPGTDKDTLLKPGAEKLLRFFGLQCSLETLDKIEDWTGEHYDGEPFFFYRYKATAMRNGQVIAEGVGSCSSWEKKYRYRTAEIVCPECGAENIRHSKHGTGWYCWAKTGGCGANFDENDERITKQPRDKVPNPNPADLVNTIDKMSQKRAIVAVTLIATNASEYFSQDIEDFIDGTFTDIEDEQESSPQPETKPKQKQKKNISKRSDPITIERALKFQNSEGKMYKDISSDELSHMTNGIAKGLAKDDITDQERKEYEDKREAIKVVLQARADGSIQ